MDALREAAETIRELISDGSPRRLFADGLSESQHYMQVSLLVLAKHQLGELDRLLADDSATPSDLTLPSDFSATVDSTIVAGDRTYDWRHLAAVMQGCDLLLRATRQNRPGQT